MEKPVIGLTGGIASGKSTVARLLLERGVAIVDADQLARDVVAVGTEGLEEVVRAFGDGVLSEDGALDRAKLGAIVFSDPAKRAALEAITHPRIAAAGLAAIASHRDGPAPYVVYEAALLVETGRHTTFPGLIVVAVSPAAQFERLVERDGFTEAEARARIASQMPMEAKVAVGTWVIHNDGDRHDLEREVDRVHRAVVARIASVPGGGR